MSTAGACDAVIPAKQSAERESNHRTGRVAGFPLTRCALAGMTIEAQSAHGRLSALQRAFHEKLGTQCGFCTPGMIMAAEALLRRSPHPAVAEIREALGGNLCRCTGYVKIIEAVQEAAR